MTDTDLIDAYLDGIATGLALAGEYEAEAARPSGLARVAWIAARILIVAFAVTGILSNFGVLPGQASARPAASSTTAMLMPAITAAGQLHPHERPVWDGRAPRVWVGQDPMREARWAGRHGWARADAHGPKFRVRCEPDGSAWAWNAVTGGVR